MEPVTIAGLTIGTEGPYITLRVEQTYPGRGELYMNAMDSMVLAQSVQTLNIYRHDSSRMQLAMKAAGSIVLGMTIPPVPFGEEDESDLRWQFGDGSAGSPTMFLVTQNEELITQARDALKNAIQTAGNFRRG